MTIPLLFSFLCGFLLAADSSSSFTLSRLIRNRYLIQMWFLHPYFDNDTVDDTVSSKIINYLLYISFIRTEIDIVYS